VITGYNTDVKHEGKVFHVQTEDKGAGNPIIETLIYVGGGQIIASRQYNYAGLVKEGKVDERVLSDMLDSQHRRMLRWVQGGKYDANGPPPFGSTIISNRTFDEVVLDFIRSTEGAEPIEIVLGEELRPVAGTAAPLKVLIRKEVSSAPVSGAQVIITLNPPSGQTVKVLGTSTGPDGTVAGKIKFPVDSAGGTLRIEARFGALSQTIDLPIAGK